MAISVGDTAPDFTLKNQHGQEISLSALRGSPVAIVFFVFQKYLVRGGTSGAVKG